MADAKISALTAATTPLAGTEVLPIVQSGTTKKVSVANLTAGRVVGMLRGNIEGAYDAAAPSTSSVPILRVNEGGAVSLWIGGQGYTNLWIQGIQDDGSNNLKQLVLQPLGGGVAIGGNGSGITVTSPNGWITRTISIDNSGNVVAV